MERIEYLPIGSIVHIEGTVKKLMIISRAINVSNGGRVLFFDYAGVAYPEGLISDKLAYFNMDKVTSVVFEGYKDSDDKSAIDNINSYLEKNPGKDLISDKILFSVQSNNEHDEQYYTENYRDDDILVYFAMQNCTRIDDAIARYNINTVQCVFEKLPYKNGTDLLDARIAVTAVREDEIGFTERDYACIAKNALGAEKTVERRMNLRGGTAYVCGYLKNPYENRLALIIAEEQFGFEGFDVLYHIVGCDIESGFER